MKTLLFAMALAIASTALAQTPRGERLQDRRSRRVHMDEVQVVSPDGQVQFTALPNAERLSYTVTLRGATVIAPSTLSFVVDGFDLASGVIFSNATRSTVNETYPWHGRHRTATNHFNGATLFLAHDLSFTPFQLEIRAFNDGVAYRFVVPGADNVSRVADEYSNFVLPAGSTVWFHD